MSPRSRSRGRGARRSRYQRVMARPNRILVVTNGEVTEKQYCELLNEAEAAKPRGERAFHIECKPKPVDPAKLVEYALALIAEDKKACERKNGGVSDSYALVFVVVDNDDFLKRNPKNLRDAQKRCDQNNIRFVISDPCFEVWLIDHVMICPSHVTSQDVAESLARKKGLTTGRNNKYLVPEELRGRVGIAVKNADAHKTAVASTFRKTLQGKSFAPWTDFPDLVRGVEAL